MGVKDIAKKIAASKAAGGGNFIKDGTGVLIVKELKQEDLYEGETFIAELLVESSTQIDPNHAPNAPGSTVSVIQQFEKFPDTAFGNTKAFMLALLGETNDSLVASAAASKAAGKKNDRGEWTEDDEFAAAYESLCSPSQPAKGMRVKFSTYRKVTKKTRMEIVLPKWEIFPGQTAESIAETRAKLEGK